MDEIKKFFFQEAMCSLILGGAASALVAAFSGVEALLDFMGAINPPKEFLFLSLALLALPH
ncbi:hypothetical protein [Algiphilus sp.]|uniref:hypothetical protein n=1 Tax=Algiphilus sp. TaxID=1872431 RepID=UPI0025BDEE81|nr:hypothetical protein [Algiphilus sp.]MCK5772096.1 hypothetical protein [Algiphilus sp.]